jgi:hypothetical protein
MKPSLPRILSAVPRTLHVQLEIAKAIRTLAAPNQDQHVIRQMEPAAAHPEGGLIAQIVRELIRDLHKAGFNLEEPRVPAGNPDGGQWTREDGDGAVISDATPDNAWKPGGQYAANNPCPALAITKVRRLKSRHQFRHGLRRSQRVSTTSSKPLHTGWRRQEKG